MMLQNKMSPSASGLLKAIKLIQVSAIFTMVALGIVAGGAMALKRDYITVEEFPFFLSGSLVCLAVAGVVLIAGFRAGFKAGKSG